MIGHSRRALRRGARSNAPSAAASTVPPTRHVRCVYLTLFGSGLAGLGNDPMDLKLAGKVVLITGSSRGIGLATAKAFAAEGCRLVLSARSAGPLAEAEAALRAITADVAARAADVSKPDEAAGLVQAAIAAFGGIDVLINNVGGGGGGARIADSTYDDWRGAIERNLVQTVRMMRLALPHMKSRAGAAVINVASISGWSPQLAMSGQYGAAKAALIFDTERWALEFVPHGIR